MTTLFCVGLRINESFEEGLSFSFAKIVVYNLSWNSLANKRSGARLGRDTGVRLFMLR